MLRCEHDSLRGTCPVMTCTHFNPSPLTAPPSTPVAWTVWDRDNVSHEGRVSAQLWYRAKELGAVVLGIPFERVVAERERAA